MELVSYTSICPQARIGGVVETVYTKFANEVLNILQNRSAEEKIFPCQYAANISILRRLLPDNYSVSDFAIKRGTKPQQLKNKLPRRRRTCVLATTSRYFIIQEKN